MKKVFVCSPYRGDTQKNTLNARAYCRFEAMSGNLPFAPHLFFVQFMDDNHPNEREAGIRMGLEIMKHCDELHVYGDLITEGMKKEITCWREMGRREHRCSIALTFKKQEMP